MPIVIVKFAEPIRIEVAPPRPVLAEARGYLDHILTEWNWPFVDLIDEVTFVTDTLPRLVHYPDGQSRRGYLDCGDGVEFDARTIEDVRIIL